MFCDIVSSSSPLMCLLLVCFTVDVFHLISTHKLLTILSQLDLKQALICC